DLGGRAQAHRRPPEAGAPAHVEQRGAAAGETPGERDREAHQPGGGPDLPPLRGAREPGGGARRARAARRGGGRRRGRGGARGGPRGVGPGERAREVLAARAEQVAAVVVDADEVEARAGGGDRDALVAQRADAERGERLAPLARAGVVVVVPGDEVDAAARAQRGERLDLRGEQRRVAVDEVAGDRDQVGRDRLDAAHAALGAGAVQDRAPGGV